jgi:hypothetical protein
VTNAAQEKSVANPWWSRLRLALTASVIVFIAITAMRTTSAPRHFDRGAFLIFEDALLPAIIASGVALALLRYGDRIRAYLDKVPRWVLDIIVFGASFAFTLRFTHRAFGGWPQIQDEIAYDLLARRIAQGNPIPASHPLYEFFRVRFMVDDGRNYVLFQPGWPLVLAFFYKIHAHTAAPAFAVGMLTLGTSRLAERVYGRFTSLLAAALVMSSGFVNVVGCAYFSHAWAAALLVLSLERLHAALTEEDPKKARRAAIAAGLWGAWLVITRLPTALTLIAAGVIGVALYSVESIRPPRLIERLKKPLLALAISFSLGPLAQAGWNLATTRHVFELPQDKYFNQTEPVPGCHRIGFGKGIGCPREHPLDTPKGGYTLERAMVVSNMRWSVFRTDAWGTGWPIALAALFLARPLRKRDAMIAAATLGPIAVYFGFYYHAIQHGARLWADMMGPLSVVIAAGAISAFEKEESASRFRLWASALAVVILVLVIHDEHTRDMPDRLVNLNKERQAERVFRQMESTGVPRGQTVVYVGNCIEPDRGDVVYGWASVLNRIPPESGDRFLVRDFGSDHDRQLVTMMPTWKHVRVDCNGRMQLFDNPTPMPRLIITEAEAKYPPDERAGCYPSIKPLANAANKQYLEIQASEPAAWIRFRQYVFEPGTYEVHVVIVRRPDSGRFTIAFDGKAMDALDGKGVFGPDVVNAGTIALTPGTHNVEIRSLEGPGKFYFGIDRLEIFRRD